jgi:hypothetical protein
LDGFHRIAVRTLDQVGGYVTCVYDGDSTQQITFAIRKQNQSAEQGLGGTRSSFATQFPKATERAPVIVPPADANWARTGFMQEPDQSTELFLTAFSGWHFSVAVHHIGNSNAAIEKAMAEFSRPLLGEGRKLLAICAAAPAVQRTRLQVVGREAQSILIAAFSVLLTRPATPVLGGKVKLAPMPDPVASCADGGMQYGPTQYVYSHDVSAEGVADRIMGRSGTPLIRTVALADPDHVLGSDAPVAVVVESADRIDVQAFFLGLPEPQALISSALDGKPLMRINKADMSVDIFYGPAPSAPSEAKPAP